MNPQEAYLADVRRAMPGMEPAVRDDILRELRSHIVESMSANGGSVGVSLAGLGSPSELGRHYRDLYGYGRTYKALFTAVAFLLAIPSVPVLVVGSESLFPYALSIVFLLVDAAWILWVGVAAGSRAGLIAGTAALVARAVAFAAAAAGQVGANTSAEGVALFVSVSILLPILGWIPGTAKKAWARPTADL